MLSIILMYGCPLFFTIGIIVIIISKKYRKLDLNLIIGSIIILTIGFGLCYSHYEHYSSRPNEKSLPNPFEKSIK
jgi:hypothetical protein